VPAVGSLDELRAAIDAFALRDVGLTAAPGTLDVARRSLRETGLLLLGEVHGVAQNPLIARELMRVTGAGGLALEWPAELAGSLSPLADHELLWIGDGRITAGHLKWLAAEAPPLTLFDRRAPARETWSERDAAMARAILGAPVPAGGLLVVAGNLHTTTRPGPFAVSLGARLAAARPGVAAIKLAYARGRYFNFREHRFVPRPAPPSPLHLAGASLKLARAVAATVPARL
jgi:hypothetical protein